MALDTVGFLNRLASNLGPIVEELPGVALSLDRFIYGSMLACIHPGVERLTEHPNVGSGPDWVNLYSLCYKLAGAHAGY